MTSTDSKTDALLAQIQALQERKRAHAERVRIAKLALEAMPTRAADYIEGVRSMGHPRFIAPTENRATLRWRAESCKALARQFGVPHETFMAAFADMWATP
jgi:hypothetical protein